MEPLHQLYFHANCWKNRKLIKNDAFENCWKNCWKTRFFPKIWEKRIQISPQGVHVGLPRPHFRRAFRALTSRRRLMPAEDTRFGKACIRCTCRDQGNKPRPLFPLEWITRAHERKRQALYPQWLRPHRRPAGHRKRLKETGFPLFFHFFKLFELKKLFFFEK